MNGGVETATWARRILARSSRTVERLWSRAALRSSGTRGRLRAASCTLRLGVGAPLPGARGASGVREALSTTSWAEGASLFRPNTLSGYRVRAGRTPDPAHRFPTVRRSPGVRRV